MAHRVIQMLAPLNAAGTADLESAADEVLAEIELDHQYPFLEDRVSRLEALAAITHELRRRALHK